MADIELVIKIDDNYLKKLSGALRTEVLTMSRGLQSQMVCNCQKDTGE